MMGRATWRPLERLENRLVFSTILSATTFTGNFSGTVSGVDGYAETPPVFAALTSRGTLTVTGADSADVIGISRKGSSLRIVGIDSSGEHVFSFPFASVRRIYADGRGGADKI